MAATLSTNNVMNPFTPFGDLSLIRMANLYANIAQIGAPADLARIFDMITAMPAKLLGKGRQGLEVGAPRRSRHLRRVSPTADTVAEIAPAVAGWKNGRQTFFGRRPNFSTQSGRGTERAKRDG